MIRERNRGNQYGDGSQLNTFHRMWLTPCSPDFHILESGEEIWSLSAILPWQILDVSGRNPSSRAHLCDGPAKAEERGSEGQKGLTHPHLPLGSQTDAVPSSMVSLPSPLPAPVSSP